MTLLAGWLLAAASDAPAQIRINEVGDGVDVQGSTKWVELYNAGSTAVDVSSYWLCNFPSYDMLSSLTVLEGELMIPAGGYVVLAFPSLGSGDGEVGLYASGVFTSTDAIRDYMQYGSAGHTRESVAVGGGVWTAGAFAEAPTAGNTLAFLGTGSTNAASWSEAAPTPGASNGADHAEAARAAVDRFSAEAGNLFVRAEGSGLPAAGEAINFDEGPFITRGLGPAGEIVHYYNMDVQPTTPAPIYVLFPEGSEAPVAGQFNIIDALPGEEGYNDFWQPVKVTVPAHYVANAITSAEALTAAGYDMETLNILVNCPVVPEGSTASRRLNAGNNAGLVNGWYKDQAVFYFEFGEAPLAPDAGSVPLSPIYVTFNINPGEPDGGPPSGFVTEAGSSQTHNVVATLPGDTEYSPLWVVNIYDNAEFGTVSDLASAEAASILVAGAANVNCPIVAVEENVAVEPVDGEQPNGFILHGNYPNPFNPSTNIRYELEEAGRVALTVYSLLGQQVAQLVDTFQPAGVYEATWDGRDAASGVYLYRLTFENRQTLSHVMTLLK